jgi:perosamine synthetase
VIPLAKPYITEDDKNAVLEVLNTRFLSLGPKLPEFERVMADYAGRRYAVAVNSGTSALHLAIKALGIGKGDEVITTPFSFIASANCILYEGAKPVFVDIEEDTFNIDPTKIESAITERTKAILPVDVFGYPCRWDEIISLANRYNLKIIEDSCEALGSEYKGRKCGSFGDISTFAFYPNKQITTGEGGIILTDEEEIYKLCKSWRNQGRGESDEWLTFDRLGYNYRIDELSCALGISQMKRIEEILRKREEVAGYYKELLGAVEEIQLPKELPYPGRVSFFVYVIRIVKGNRDEIMRRLNERGIQCKPYFYPPIHLQPFYRKLFGYKEGDFPVTEKISREALAIPFYTEMSFEEAKIVANAIKESLCEFRPFFSKNQIDIKSG